MGRCVQRRRGGSDPIVSGQHTNWKAGDAWPADVPRLVRNRRRADGHPRTDGDGVVFYGGQRVRPGMTFSLSRPQDYSSLSMEPADGAADDLARKIDAARETNRLPGQNRAREMSSA